MQTSTITTSENQVNVNVTTSETRVKDFTFGENNEHHIIQSNEDKEPISTLAVNDGLGLNSTTAIAVADGGSAKLEITTDNEIKVYVNEICIGTVTPTGLV